VLEVARVVTPVTAPAEETFKAEEAIVKASLAEPIPIVSAVVLSVPMFMILPAVPVPIFTVFALLLVPRFTVPVEPESSVKTPVVPEVMFKADPAAEATVKAPLSAILCEEKV